MFEFLRPRKFSRATFSQPLGPEPLHRQAARFRWYHKTIPRRRGRLKLEEKLIKLGGTRAPQKLDQELIFLPWLFDLRLNPFRKERRLFLSPHTSPPGMDSKLSYRWSFFCRSHFAPFVDGFVNPSRRPTVAGVTPQSMTVGEEEKSSIAPPGTDQQMREDSGGVHLH